MIAWYAHGGGLGHLTRMRAVRHTLDLDDIVLLTASPPDPRITDVKVHSGDPMAAIRELRPDLLVVDAFPAGLHGELRESEVPAVHLARLLRWDAYRRLLPARPPRFTTTWLVEPVTADHEAYLRSVSGEVTGLRISEPPARAPAELEPGTWLIVHSGPADEVHELLAYARDVAEASRAQPRYLVICPLPLRLDVPVWDVYPAWPLFPAAERIFTAAGCNAVRQLAPYRHKHHVLPFPRRYDDQFTRAARLRS